MITRAGLRAACGGRASLLASSRLAPRAASFAPRGPRVTSTEALHFSRPRLFSLRAAAGASGERAAPQWDIKVLYDGDCPLCMKEIDFLRERDAGRGKIAFVDIAAADYSPAENANIPFETAMERIHAVLPDGRVVTNIEVFRRLYEAVGLGWVYAITKWGPVSRLAESVYNFWARYRLQVTGRPNLADVLEARRRLEAGEKCGTGDGACSIDTAGSGAAAAKQQREVSAAGAGGQQTK